MIGKNTKFMRGIALGLMIVAILAIAAALIIGYRKNGGVNFLLIGLGAVILSANLLAIRRSKKSGK